MRVAVIGTGTMGAGMARSLRRAGHEVAAWNRTRDKAEPLADDGIDVAGSVEEAVSGADAVLTMLFDADAVLSVREELVGALGGEAVWVQSSTVGPDGVRRIAEGVERIVDAPMLGTKEPAEQGALVVLASGPGELLERARPVFDAVGQKLVVAGDSVGQASALKLACNAWIAVLTAGAAQSITLAARLGVDPRHFLEAIDGGPTGAPYVQLKGKTMLADDYPPSFALDGLRKDIGLMHEAGGAAGYDTTLLDCLAGVFGKASDAGHGAEDIAAVKLAFTG